MDKYTTRSEASQALAAGQTHGDLHPGRGVIAMPTHDDIAHRAYDIYVKSGCNQGQCKQNWHQAEHELRSSLTVQIDVEGRNMKFSMDWDHWRWRSLEQQEPGDFPLIAVVGGKRYELYSDGTFAEEEE